MKKIFLKATLLCTALACAILLPKQAVKAAFEAPHYSLEANGGEWDGTYYIVNDEIIKNAFFFDGNFTYYLQHDGTPMVDKLTYHPDGEHIIYFDNEGHEVFNAERHITESISGEAVSDYCYFGAEGHMYKDQIAFIYSSHTSAYDQPVYYNVNGVKQNNGQFHFADGNLGIAKKDGRLLHNSFGYDAFGQIVYFHWNGTIAKGLISDGSYFYDMDLTDGHLKGWFSAEGVADSPVFPGNMKDTDEPHVKNVMLYDMRLTGDNAITNKLTDWYSLDDVTTYMNHLYGTEEDWKLNIYRDANGNIVDSVTQTNGTYATYRGVKIGDSRESVRAAYNGVEYNEERKDFLSKHWVDLFESLSNDRVDEYIITVERDRKNCVDLLETILPDYVKVYGIRFYYDANNCVERIQYFYYQTANNGIKRVVTKYTDTTVFPIDFDASTSKYATENTIYQWYDSNQGVGVYQPMEGQTRIR